VLELFDNYCLYDLYCCCLTITSCKVFLHKPTNLLFKASWFKALTLLMLVTLRPADNSLLYVYQCSWLPRLAVINRHPPPLALQHISSWREGGTGRERRHQDHWCRLLWLLLLLLLGGLLLVVVVVVVSELFHLKRENSDGISHPAAAVVCYFCLNTTFSSVQITSIVQCC